MIVICTKPDFIKQKDLNFQVIIVFAMDLNKKNEPSVCFSKLMIFVLIILINSITSKKMIYTLDSCFLDYTLKSQNNFSK